jgi:hypothetical protein
MYYVYLTNKIKKSSEADSELKFITFFTIISFMTGGMVTLNCVVICAHIGHTVFPALRRLHHNVRPAGADSYIHDSRAATLAVTA